MGGVTDNERRPSGPVDGRPVSDRFRSIYLGLPDAVRSSAAEGGKAVGPYPAAGPNVIAATGGSGTRVLARIARSGGMFVGKELDRHEDAQGFARFCDRWIDAVASAETVSALDPLIPEMTDDLAGTVREHVLRLGRRSHCWGWKQPRTIFLLPFVHALMPELRFLHVVRDGRDIAYSPNQTSLLKHGSTVLDADGPATGAPWSIRLWSEINTLAADYGESQLGDAYLRVRFEDLCADGPEQVERVFRFFDLRGNPGRTARREIRQPKSLGRWKLEPPGEIDAIEEIAGPALRRFGYLGGE